MNDELGYLARSSLADFLAQYTWDFWFTATSAKTLRYPRQAIGMALDELSGTPRGFVAAERHYLGGWHAHGLIRTSLDLDAKAGAQVLFTERLSRHGFCKVESARSTHAVTNYLTKYILKGHDADWEFWGTNSWLDKHEIIV